MSVSGVGGFIKLKCIKLFILSFFSCNIMFLRFDCKIFGYVCFCKFFLNDCLVYKWKYLLGCVWLVWSVRCCVEVFEMGDMRRDFIWIFGLNIFCFEKLGLIMYMILLIVKDVLVMFVEITILCSAGLFGFFFGVLLKIFCCIVGGSVV